ncbi:MAG: 50S ribosomal protein L28 [Candidatus Riflebacteria bacterium]|nr:50S ribosomal protein L28 [Candidatus Riflebacteria bacterium]
MSRTCLICERGPQTFYQLSHSHRRSKRRWSINLQRKRIMFRGKMVKGYICTRCLGTQAAQMPG